MNDYTAQGYNSRKHSLECLADDFGVSFSTVCAMAAMLGPNEDFDGLVTALEDYAEEL